MGHIAFSLSNFGQIALRRIANRPLAPIGGDRIKIQTQAYEIIAFGR